MQPCLDYLHGCWGVTAHAVQQVFVPTGPSLQLPVSSLEWFLSLGSSQYVSSMTRHYIKYSVLESQEELCLTPHTRALMCLL